jgi:hypothetical protein
VDAAAALAGLIEVSSQIEAAVIADAGAVLASTRGEGTALAEAGSALLASAPASRDHGAPAQIGVTMRDGGVFVLRDGARTIVATTGPEPTVGLVFYDLKTCLRSLEAPKPKARRTRKKENGAS